MELLADRSLYPQLLADIKNELDDPVPVLRWLCQNDLFFLLAYALGRHDADRDWIFDRCREVQAEPDGYLDLWGREHYKSTVITFALTIQDILNDPDITIGIFSHTRKIAKKFLLQIKREMETNEQLKLWFPEIFYADPQKQAPKWSEDDGLVVKRGSNPKESTIEAWGLVDGQPTSKHYKLLLYDDVVTLESVTTPEMIEKTTDCLAMSYNLGAAGGRRRFIGTRYHHNDTYKAIIGRGTVKVRLYPATHDGSMDGEPVLLTQEQLDEKKRDMGVYVYCLPGDAPILMADFTEKKMKDIVVGDSVVGYIFPGRKRTRIIASKVLAISTQEAMVYEYELSSGRKVQCTSTHKWHTGRRGNDHRHQYAKIDVKSNNSDNTVNHLSSFYDPRKLNEKYDFAAANWLSGFYDGEGSSSGNSVHFHQSEKYPKILERLEKNLEACGFDYGMSATDRVGIFESNRTSGYIARDYYLRGGREAAMRFLNICKPSKAEAVINAIYNRDSRCFNKTKYNRDKVVSKKDIGVLKVYNMSTETGNYIAYGYASKNSSQMLMNPTADASQGFKADWVKYTAEPIDIKNSGFTWYLVVDAANGKRKKNDYTSIWAVGLGHDDNFYAIPEVRDRLNLTERAKALMYLHRKYKPMEVRYERYGMMADIAYIKLVQEQQNYRFDIIEVAGTSPKNDRIRRLVPLFQSGRVYLPVKKYVVDYEGKSRDLVADFVNDEYLAFPVPLHDDMLDALSRITDDEGWEPDTNKRMELRLAWPMPFAYREQDLYPEEAFL